MFLLRSARQQPRILLAIPPTRATALASVSRRFASSDYGSGEHNDLKRSKSELEHPGPPPPSTGDKGSKGASKSEPEDGGKAQPKISNASPPKEGEEPEEVKKHNEEMKNRKA